ncbi:MAG: 4-amino-4-deoxy-L-arabinose transferase-like glycosyltransferase [Myxococcota bacterium]|jgi:4-amino-4-deoxy-L-arabinose transferase-like glycosyltransferase
MGLGLALRAVPLAVWAREWGCIRDECTYIKLASRMISGEGMTSSVGWLWAPGYPFLMAIHGYLTTWSGSIRISQILVSLAIAVLMYRLAEREGGKPAGRWAAWLYMLSPTMIFFSQSLWSECLYGGLLLSAIWVFERARDRLDDARVRDGLLWAAGIGAMVGCCMLFRGVATYMLPLFAVGLLWGRFRASAAWGQAGLLFLCAALTVAPYSIYATNKFEERIVTDRTIGQMMWLGNNDFDPITFDWGNGTLSKHAWRRHTSEGRRHCGSIRNGLERDHCEADAGIAWIKANPKEFVARMPLRVAQLLNPHSFLTRHLRWGYWRGLPQAVDEGIILWNVVWSLSVLFGGVAALCARGRGARSVLVALLLLYHVAAISVLAGLTRYRVPLEPLLMLYLASALGDPSGTLATLRTQRWRIPVMLLMLAIGAPLVLWFLPAGWPTWRTW